MILPDLRPTIKSRGRRDIRQRNDVAYSHVPRETVRVAHHVDAPFGRRVRLLECLRTTCACVWMHTSSQHRRRSLAEDKFTRSRRGVVRRGAPHAHRRDNRSLYLNGQPRTRSVRSGTVKCPANGTVWYLFLCSRPSDRSGPGCFSTDRNVRSKCRCSNVSCSSHYDAQLTAFFIDPRAK